MKTIKLWVGMLFFGLMVAGCAESDMDKDGVPKIDLHGRIEVQKVKFLDSYQDQEYRVVTVRGKDMNLTEFVNTYCLGKELSNPTCARAAKIKNSDQRGSSDGKLRLAPGL